jgi:primosomal protein N' (replication factor Y)
VVQYAAAHDYKSFYEAEMQQRQQFFYPPYSRMINITLKHKDPDAVKQAAHYFLKYFRLPATVRMLGPVTPVVSRIKNLYLQEIILKVPKNSLLLQQTKEQIIAGMNQLSQNTLLKAVQFHVDVDGY